MATREKLLIFTLIFNLLCITCICDEKLVNIEGRVLLYKAYKGFHYFLNSHEDNIWRFDNNLKFVNKIGKRGEGPGELINLHNFNFVDNKIYLYSKGKISIFDLEGNLIQEIRNPFFSVKCILKNGNIICKNREFIRSESGKLFIMETIRYCNKNFKELFKIIENKKEITPGFRFEAIEPLIDVKYSVKNRLFYISYPIKDFLIMIFDESGKKIGCIFKKYKRKIKVTKNFKKRFFDAILNDPIIKSKEMAEEVKKLTHFPKYFPPFHSFYINEDGNIYVRTYRRVKDKVEFEKYGKLGKYICKYELPDNFINIADAQNYIAFSNNNYFYLYINNEGNYILYSEELE